MSIDFVCLAFINLSILDLSGAIFKKNIFENLWWNTSAVNVLTVNRKNSIPEGAEGAICKIDIYVMNVNILINTCWKRFLIR